MWVCFALFRFVFCFFFVTNDKFRHVLAGGLAWSRALQVDYKLTLVDSRGLQINTF